MHVYRVGYTSCEDSSFIMLLHEKKFSREELEEVVIGAIVDLLKEYKFGKQKREQRLVDGPCSTSPTNLPRLLFNSNMEWPWIFNVSNLFPEIGPWLERYGFKIIESEEEVVLWGWANPFEKGSWQRPGYADDLDMRLYEAIKKAGFTEEDYGGWEHEQSKEIHDDNANSETD